MTIYDATELKEAQPKTHPWTFGERDSEFRYVDFKVAPELIRTELEDFRDFASQSSVQLFYAFLEWINGPASRLETNDCAFRSPSKHAGWNTRKSLQCDGRVCVFCRHLHYNLNADTREWLKLAYANNLAVGDPNFADNEGLIGLTEQPTYYTSISYRVAPREILGGLLMISFWAYGMSADECFANFG